MPDDATREYAIDGLRTVCTSRVRLMVRIRTRSRVRLMVCAFSRSVRMSPPASPRGEVFKVRPRVRVRVMAMRPC